MDITRQVFRRSVRMGLPYVILGVAMGLLLTGAFGFGIQAVRSGTVTNNGVTVNLSYLGLLVIPVAALAGILTATPVFYLFVLDKNAGVLEYLLAVGMSQRDVFMGYLKAALLISLFASVPAVLLNLAVGSNGLGERAAASGISLVLGFADVAFVTVLMTAFSSMQRKPTGMNSPFGIAVGALILIPVFIFNALGSAFLGPVVLWLDIGVAVALLLLASFLLLSVDRLITREKLLP